MLSVNYSSITHVYYIVYIILENILLLYFVIYFVFVQITSMVRKNINSIRNLAIVPLIQLWVIREYDISIFFMFFFKI